MDYNEHQKGSEEAESTPAEGTPLMSEQTNREQRCPKCLAIVEDQQVFCAECGCSLKKACPHCKAELQDDLIFCPNCGEKIKDTILISGASAKPKTQPDPAPVYTSTPKKQVNPIIFLLVAMVAIVVFVGFNRYREAQEELHRVNEYKADAVAFSSVVLEASINLEKIGNEMQSTWYDVIFNEDTVYTDINEAFDALVEEYSEEFAMAKEHKYRIEELYVALKIPANNSAQIVELRDGMEELYVAYEEMYDVVIEFTGNYPKFKSEFSECDEEVVETYRKYAAMCEKYAQ